MSVETLDALKQRTGALSAGEKRVLAAYLLEKAGPKRPKQRSSTGEAKRRKREAWIKANRGRYGGLYVALDGERLLGTGKTYPEAYEAARDAGSSNAFVDFIPPADYVGEAGGWD